MHIESFKNIKSGNKSQLTFYFFIFLEILSDFLSIMYKTHRFLIQKQLTNSLFFPGESQAALAEVSHEWLLGYEGREREEGWRWEVKICVISILPSRVHSQACVRWKLQVTQKV